MSPAAMQELRGLGVSGGVAVGRAVCIRTRVGEVIRFPIAEEEVDREVARFEEALRRDRTELARLRHKAGDQLGEELGAIFEAHLLMLQDPAFTGRILERIRGERVNAEWAVQQAVEETGERFASIEDEYLRAREQDLRDVARHLLRTLSGLGHHELSEIGGVLQEQFEFLFDQLNVKGTRDVVEHTTTRVVIHQPRPVVAAAAVAAEDVKDLAD